jgi:hypothetical protein
VKIKIACILSFFVFILGAACTNQMDNLEEYLAYLADETNGIVHSKSVAGVQMKVKYMPIEYLVYKDFTNQDKKGDKKKLFKEYKNTLSFMLTLGPDKNENFDITRVGVSSYEEFTERMEVMNFQMGGMISLEYGDKTIHPKLSLMENTYGLAQERAILVSFEVSDNLENAFMKNNDCKFIYKDGLFNTGISKFAFDKTSIRELPEFQF